MCSNVCNAFSVAVKTSAHRTGSPVCGPGRARNLIRILIALLSSDHGGPFNQFMGYQGDSLPTVSPLACGVFVGKHACRPGSNGDTGMTAFYNSPPGADIVQLFIISFVSVESTNVNLAHCALAPDRRCACASLISLAFAVFPVRGQFVMLARLPLGLVSLPERAGQTYQGSVRG